MPKHVRTYHPLDALLEKAGSVVGFEKAHLRRGDVLFVKTRNSTYKILVRGEGIVEVTGGWFDKKGLSPMRTSIAGCTWGGSAIMTGWAAACGLCLEFGNRLITTPVVKILPLLREQQN